LKGSLFLESAVRRLGKWLAIRVAGAAGAAFNQAIEIKEFATQYTPLVRQRLPPTARARL
jgi:hypothetical protein